KLEAEWIEKQRANFWKGWVTPSGGMPLSPPGNNIGQTDLVRRTSPGSGAENTLLKYPPLLTVDGVTGQSRKRIEFAAGLGFDLYNGGSGGNANCLAIAIFLGVHFANKGVGTPVSREEIGRQAAALRMRAHALMQRDLIALRNRFEEQLQNHCGLHPTDMEQIINVEIVTEEKIHDILSDSAYANMSGPTKTQCEEIIEGFQLAIARVRGLLNDKSNRPEGGGMMDTEFGGCMARDLGTDVLVIDCDYLGGSRHPCHYFPCDIGERVEAMYNHEHEWYYEDEPKRLGRCMNGDRPPAVIFRFPEHFISGNYVGPWPLLEPPRSDSTSDEPGTGSPTSPPSDLRLDSRADEADDEDELKPADNFEVDRVNQTAPMPPVSPIQGRKLEPEYIFLRKKNSDELAGDEGGFRTSLPLGRSASYNQLFQVIQMPWTPLLSGPDLGDNSAASSVSPILFDEEGNPFVPASLKKRKTEIEKTVEECEELMRRWDMTPLFASFHTLSRWSSSRTSSGEDAPFREPSTLSVSPLIPRSDRTSEHSQDEAESMARKLSSPASRLSSEREISSEDDSAANPEPPVKKVDEEMPKKVVKSNLPNDKISVGMMTRKGKGSASSRGELEEKGRKNPPTRDVNKQPQGLSPWKSFPKNRK
ncbi:MAG: hypothetical protein LBF25_03150, partial [Puniceicoccales bacterium]|nr:hypothetical protein [Puniceicoccales bacterium]